MAYATSSIYLTNQPQSPVDLAMELSMSQRLEHERRLEPIVKPLSRTGEAPPLNPIVAPANSNLPELDFSELLLPETAAPPITEEDHRSVTAKDFDADDFDSALAELVASTASIQPPTPEITVARAISAAVHTAPEPRRKFPLRATALGIALCCGIALGTFAGLHLAAPQHTGHTGADALQHELKFLRGQVSSLTREISGLRGQDVTKMVPANIPEVRAAQPSTPAPDVRASISVVSPTSGSNVSRTSEGPGRSQAAAAIGATAAPTHDGATRPTIVEGFVLRDVYGSTALIQSRKSLHEAKVGEIIPGLGRIEAIRRDGNRWIVETPKGQLSAGVL